MATPSTDLLGRPLTPVETELLDLYGRLKDLLGRDDLEPCTRAAVRNALAELWNGVNDLALEHEQLIDLGV
ncbi:MAG TPA: hypothetical protein VE776_12380 [Actinomycetota bacterium]|jgi:hypothetical protein|nr:hypothetical protein [Actinomycetota bacterium]